jgi:hypothetical protein
MLQKKKKWGEIRQNFIYFLGLGWIFAVGSRNSNIISETLTVCVVLSFSSWGRHGSLDGSKAPRMIQPVKDFFFFFYRTAVIHIRP